MKKKASLSKEKIIAIYIFVVGFVLSFLIPTWEIPDEKAHIDMIGSAVGIENMGEIISEEIPLDLGRIEFNYDEKVDIQQQKEAMSTPATYDRSDLLPKKISVSIIKHLPSVIGIEFGVLLHLPIYWVLMLGEWFSLLFYTFICYCALKIMPMKKEMLAFIMLFPMSIQQAASLSYDAVLLPLCYFFVSYILYLKYEKENIGLKDIMILLGVWLVIVYIKVPSVFIILFALLLPLKKIQIQIKSLIIDEKMIKKWRVPFCIIGILFVGIVGYLFRSNVWIQLVLGYLLEIKRGIWLYVQTAVFHAEELMVSTVGMFGWWDTPISMKVVVLVFAFLFFLSITKNKGERMNELKGSERILIFVVFALLCGFTAMSMTHHTIMVILFGSEAAPETYEIRKALYEIPYIGGLQGRYFLPFVPLLFLLVPHRIEVQEKWRNVAFGFTEILLYAYVVIVLLQRFWWF